VSSNIRRRDFLFRLGAGVAATAASPALLANEPAAGESSGGEPTSRDRRNGGRRRALRVAHLTDIHVQPELRAAQGLAACLRHVQSLPDPPQLILNTGDCVMDAMKRDRARTELQWDVWRSVWRAECSLPVAHAIGNHDVWGWNKARSQTTGEEAGWGKRWALDALGLAKSFHSFDRAGWHFVALDSVQPFEDRYQARLDDEQFAWLEADLAKTDVTTPVLVMSHIPIFSIAPLMDPKVERPDGMQLGNAAMLGDGRRIKDLFKRHPNVKACVSGHIHLVDRVDYAGVTYLCNGAVSGNWWKGSRFNECEPGYALLDLYDDGAVERRYVPYGWVSEPGAVPAAAD
jgi:3',5'-cyclic AMP phosphodiesterase CpdA